MHLRRARQPTLPAAASADSGSSPTRQPDPAQPDPGRVNVPPPDWASILMHLHTGRNCDLETQLAAWLRLHQLPLIDDRYWAEDTPAATERVSSAPVLHESVLHESGLHESGLPEPGMGEPSAAPSQREHVQDPVHWRPTFTADGRVVRTRPPRVHVPTSGSADGRAGGAAVAAVAADDAGADRCEARESEAAESAVHGAATDMTATAGAGVGAR
jgi:hypothetical protein